MRKRQVPGSHQEVLLARASRCARRSGPGATLKAGRSKSWQSSGELGWRRVPCLV